ncbi:VgrG-related protein [Cryptosporangium arvum]|uniref:VgrG-related protein n=1 Tax=Cryptosporangium arvum TaxID=80871 RepID=UPI0004B2E2BA|nr:VgrG-related protein [Cryptosporangium arvum]
MTRILTSVLAVDVDGAPLPDQLNALLLEGWVDTSVTVPAAFGLVFSDPYGTVLRDNRQLTVGAKVKLSAITDGTRSDPLLTGEITALEMDADTAGRTLLVRGYDPGHRLVRVRRVEGYPNMTAADIVRKLAGQAGVRVGRIDPTPTVYDLATQPNLTDWDFLTRLARENDVRLYFDEDGALQFRELPKATSAPSDTTPSTQSPYVLEFGTNTQRSRVGLTASGQVKKVEVRGWDVKTKRALSAETPAGTSPDVQPDLTPAQLVAKFGTAGLVETSVPYTTQAQVQHASEALAHDVAGSSAELEVTVTGNPSLRPGQPVAVNGAGFPFEGRYTVTDARHVFASGRQYVTRVGVSGRQFRSLYGLTSGGSDDAPNLPGVVIAQVSNVRDPLNMARVKVKFPWLSDTYESDWCRVAQFGGVRGGGLMLPDVDDEVLVAFDRGSLEHPYVLAGLYNGKDRPTKQSSGLDPVDGTSGRINWRSVTTRAGHALELIDAPTKAGRGVRLQTGDGNLSVHLDQSKTTVTIDSTGTVTISGTRAVKIRSAGDLDLSAARSVTISGGGAVNIRAGGRVGVNAGGAVMIDAVGAVNAKAAGPVSVQSALNTSVTATTITLTGVTLRNGVPF